MALGDQVLVDRVEELTSGRYVPDHCSSDTAPESKDLFLVVRKLFLK